MAYLTWQERLSSGYSVDDSGCWIWAGVTDMSGYGKIKRDGKWPSTHRASYELHVGPIPDGSLVLHRCDVRRCINPEHLFLGSHAENAADKVMKGRAGRSGGGRPKLDDAAISDVVSRALAGESIREVARHHGIHESSVRYHVRQSTTPDALKGDAK